MFFLWGSPFLIYLWHGMGSCEMQHGSLWIFHGEDDGVVSVDFSRKMYEALSKEKASVRLTIYPKVNHNSWDNSFAEPDLMHWLFSNKR